MTRISFEVSLPPKHLSSYKYFVERQSASPRSSLRRERAREFSRSRTWERRLKFMERAQQCSDHLLEQMNNDIASDPTIVDASHWTSSLMRTERELTRIYLFGHMPDALLSALCMFFHACHPEAVATCRAPHYRKTTDIWSSLKKGAHLKLSCVLSRFSSACCDNRIIVLCFRYSMHLSILASFTNRRFAYIGHATSQATFKLFYFLLTIWSPIVH